MNGLINAMKSIIRKLRFTKSQHDKPYFLSIVAVFKNEAMGMEEWLNHYIMQGVEHFYLIDNGSTDNYKEIFSKFNNITCIVNPKKHCQTKHYNKYLSTVKKYAEWVAVVDLDEFVYARKGFNKIKDFLLTVNDDVGCISLAWKMFGSNGHIVQPTSIRTGFTRRRVGCSEESNNKEIVRTNKLLKFRIHSHKIRKCEKIKLPVLNNEESLNQSVLHLNHYAIQSRQFFENIKMKRGDASNPKYEDIRTWEYFRDFDHNDILDEELKNISLKI